MVKLECLFLSQTQVNRLTPKIRIQILQAALHTFLKRIRWENLMKDQSIYPVVIINILVIVITFSLDDMLILLGEN